MPHIHFFHFALRHWIAGNKTFSHKHLIQWHNQDFSHYQYVVWWLSRKGSKGREWKIRCPYMKFGAIYATLEVKFVFKHLHTLGTKKKSASVMGAMAQCFPSPPPNTQLIVLITPSISHVTIPLHRQHKHLVVTCNSTVTYSQEVITVISPWMMQNK